MTARRPAIALAAAIPALAGCAERFPERSEAYNDGWRFGCYEDHDSTGEVEWWAERQMAPDRRDEPRFDRGWRDGYQWCRDRVISRPTGGG